MSILKSITEIIRWRKFPEETGLLCTVLSGEITSAFCYVNVMENAIITDNIYMTMSRECEL